MESHKRKGDFSTSARKMPKLTDSKPGAKMTFAQRMMAKMGHVEGRGLGAAGEGIINPIEVKLRPQGAGVGAVKEKTEQYKAEERRKAEMRGEEYEDSSEEERKARTRRRKERKEGAKAAGAAGAVGARKVKVKYRTVEEVRAAAPGLELPKAMLGSIVDATGSQTKLLTSTAGLMSGGLVKAETEEEKVKRRERLELEAFIEAWHGLQERKLHLEQHEGQLQVGLTQMAEDTARLKEVISALAALQVVQDVEDDASGATQWTGVIQRLTKLQEEHRHEIESCGLGDAAIAVLAPIFKDEMDAWDPLEVPSSIVDDLMTLRPLLGIKTEDEVAVGAGVDPEQRRYRKTKATTPFETLIYRVWLPKVRSAITNWDVHESRAAVSLIQSWRPILPAFVFNNVVDQLVVPKLADAMKAWNPKKLHKERSLPHTWLFPWLPHVPSYHLDPSSPTGLMHEVKRMLRHALSSCDVTLGPIPGLQLWSSILPADIPHLLVRHLLPRLASYLALHFEVNPLDQQLTPLDAVLLWKDYFKPEIFARLFVAEFFPKILEVQHHWITSIDADLNEVSPWLEWWKSVFPTGIQKQRDMQQGWAHAQKMIDDTMDIIERGGDLAADLAPPADKSLGAKAKNKKVQHEASTETGSRKAVAEMSFKDFVDEWCAEQDLTLLPLREAHAATGSPLFRVTASATGRGGVVVYFWGDNIWVQKKGQREVFEPYGLDETLVRRAEGK